MSFRKSCCGCPSPLHREHPCMSITRELSSISCSSAVNGFGGSSWIVADFGCPPLATGGHPPVLRSSRRLRQAPVSARVLQGWALAFLRSDVATEAAHGIAERNVAVLADLCVCRHAGAELPATAPHRRARAD